jgi:hypothetical protein
MKRLAIIFALVAGGAFAANEITLNWTFKAEKGGLVLNRTLSRQYGITNATPGVSGYTVAVTTNAAGTALPLAISTNGWGWLLNTSSNYTVDVGTQVGGTFYPVARLGRMEGFPIRFAPNVTNYARANSGTNGAVVIECPIVDD